MDLGLFFFVVVLINVAIVQHNKIEELQHFQKWMTFESDCIKTDARNTRDEVEQLRCWKRWVDGKLVK